MADSYQNLKEFEILFEHMFSENSNNTMYTMLLLELLNGKELS